MVLLNYPQALRGCDSDMFQASLTDAGKQLLEECKGKNAET